jgi:hypothetical protein
VRRKVTCPETGHLEEIEVAEDPVDGHLLGATGCSRFSPEDHVDCDQICVKRLNQRLTNLIRVERTGPQPLIDADEPVDGDES